MKEKRKRFSLVVALVLLGLEGTMAAWGYNSDSVLLKDIEILTLYSGKMTAGGRSSPVPQLECVSGGTAPCDAFRPRVVQCYNRGYDGVDVQWECKSDMDNAYRFGEIEVSCEGYSHRDDPYVLRGSCGLRYSLDYTKEGLNQQKGHNYYGSDSGYSSYSGYGNSYQSYKSSKLSFASTLSDIIVFVAAALMIWAFYKTCCGSSRQAGEDAYSRMSDDYPAGGGGGGGGGGPGYGWFGGQGGNNQQGQYPGGNYADGNASCRNRGANAGGGGGGGGFWTGAAAGGLLGYMFGNRGNQYQNYGHYGGYHQPRRAGGWFGGGGGGGGWTTGGGGGGWSGGGSTGTRTASGFGGTSRR